MNTFLKSQHLGKNDEAWLVIDTDAWEQAHILELYEWSKASKNRGIAVSNPKFEYWLLLHFEEGVGIASTRDCSTRLLRHLRDYEKMINMRDFTPGRIKDAARRASDRDTPPCPDWPRHIGNTTVYRLVRKLLNG